MQTYWDLTEKERAELTREGVARFVDAELMLKGVLAAEPLELVDVPDPHLAPNPFYRPMTKGMYGAAAALNVAFDTEEAARAFLALAPRVIERDWQLGDVEIATLVENDAPIQTCQAITRVAADNAKSSLQAMKAAKEENDRRRRRYEEQQKKVDEALRGLWDDWHSCGSKARRMSEINATREKYRQLAGEDLVTAQKFLSLVYTTDELAEAAEWGGEKPPPPAPVPGMPTNVNEIHF